MIEAIALALGVIGGLIIILGSIIALFAFLKIHLHLHPKKIQHGQAFDRMRLNFVRHITFGLEFFIAKDVIETILVPSWQELGQLGGLVAIRIALSYFLAWELKAVEKKK